MVRCSQKDMFPIDFHAPGARSDSVSSRWPLHISSCCYFPSQKLESQLRRFEFEFCHRSRVGQSSGARARTRARAAARRRGPEQRRARALVGCHLGEELRVFALLHFLQNPGLGVWYCEELRVFALQHFLHNPG